MSAIAASRGLVPSFTVPSSEVGFERPHVSSHNRHGYALKAQGASFTRKESSWLGLELTLREHQVREERAVQRPLGCICSALEAPEEAPIVSRHTHALGRNSGEDLSISVRQSPRFRPWLLFLPPKQTSEPRTLGHAQVMCPDSNPPPRRSDSSLRLPRVAGPPIVKAPAFVVTTRELCLVLGAGGLVLLAVLNKILFKMAIASMPDQPFVLANICTLG